MNNDKPSFKVVDILPFKDQDLNKNKTAKMKKAVPKSNIYSKYLEDSYQSSDDGDLTKPF